MIQRRMSIALVACILIACIAGVASAGTVTVTVSPKSGTSDTKTLIAKAVRVTGDQVGVYIESTLLKPQQVKVKFSGLKDQDYDIYINGEASGSKSAKELTDGIDRTIPGRGVDEAAIRCIRALLPKIKPAYDSIRARQGAEPWRAAYTLGQANGWVTSGARADEAYRSVEIIIAPAGNPLERMVFASRKDAKETAEAVANACDLLHLARARMYMVLTDADLRNETVDALTPVALKAVCSVKNGKPYLTASVTNDCDLPITGKIVVTTPKGWKTVGAKLDIGKLSSGKTYSTTFALAPSGKNATLPASVPLSAVVDITSKGQGARLWLYATATLK
jgi:hypothetical protein